MTDTTTNEVVIGKRLQENLVFLYLASTKSFGVSYLWPLVPFNARGLWASLWRTPIPMQVYRPALTHPQDRERQVQPAAKPLQREHHRQDRQRGEKWLLNLTVITTRGERRPGGCYLSVK